MPAMRPGRKCELCRRSMPDTYRALFFPAFFLLFFAAAAGLFFFDGFLAAFFFVTCLAVFFLVDFFLAALAVGAALPAAFFLAVFLLAALLTSAETDFLADFLALPVVVPRLPLAGFLFSGIASTGCSGIAATVALSTSCGAEVSGSAATASTTRTGAAIRVAGATDASASALHSRSACASRGETSGYSGASPTVGRIFQERAHLVPTAISTTTATPGTSFSLNASADASSWVAIAFEVMQTSARSSSNSVSKMFWSET